MGLVGTRIVLLAHWLTDVLVSLGVGVAVERVMRWLTKPVPIDGGRRVTPGSFNRALFKNKNPAVCGGVQSEGASGASSLYSWIRREFALRPRAARAAHSRGPRRSR
jgi:hypothetical protein